MKVKDLSLLETNEEEGKTTVLIEDATIQKETTMVNVIISKINSLFVERTTQVAQDNVS